MDQTLGDRVRELRLERGLSQADLARGLVSSSYVSLIEAGKRLPDERILQSLADRLGSSAEYLRTGVAADSAREDLLALRYAELALANGEIAEALRRFEPLTGHERHGAAAQWGVARALEANGDLYGAIERIEPLLAEHRAGRADTPGLLILLNAQCRLYRQAGDLSHAITLGEAAVAEVRGLGLTGTEDEIRLASTLVGSYWYRGDLAKANQLAGEVIARAEKEGSPRARGSAYWNASMVASLIGRVPLALELANRALALFSETDDERGLARLRSGVAWILLQQSPPDLPRVHELLSKSHAALTAAGLSSDLAHVELEFARYHYVCGELDEALRVAERSIARFGGLMIQDVASVQVIRGYVLHARGDRDGALRDCHEASALLHRLGRNREHMRTWRQIAELLVRLGEPGEAIDAYRELADCGNTPLPGWIASTVDDHSVSGRPSDHGQPR